MNFCKLPSEDIYLNLDHFDSVEAHSASRVTLRRPSGPPSDVEGEDARAILAHIRGTDNASFSPQAREKAQELTQLLSEDKGGEFTFTDADGNSRKGTVHHQYGGWVAMVDGRGYEGESKEAAMEKAMSGGPG